MEICIITGLYPPYGRGGAEAVAASAATEFNRAGHEVIVITAKPFSGMESLWPKKTVENGIIIYRFFPLNIFFYGNIGKHNFLLRAFWHLFDIWNIHASFCLAHILEKVRPDIVATHNLKGFGLIVPSTLYSVRRDKEIPYKWIHTAHDVQLVSPSGLLRPGEENKLHNKIFSFLTRALFCSPDVVVSPSKWLLDFYSERGFFPKSDKKVVKNLVKRGSLINVSGSIKNSFLYLGQIEEHKGILFLLDAWKGFSASHPDVGLTIAGGGALLPEVIKIAKEMPSVKVLGAVPHGATGSLYGAHRATIVPSLVYENAPAVISESLSYGVPVLASRIGGIPEMVDEGISGLLFAPGNIDSLLAAMEKFVAVPFVPNPPQPQNYAEQILLAI
ncbi:glycosyltransferase [Candidatus Uhrbacteria bacterium]|nr:glycosyltransferase [Candidatus Uhrbacteria bacterium]